MNHSAGVDRGAEITGGGFTVWQNHTNYFSLSA
jgi:hypothetical protein